MKQSELQLVKSNIDRLVRVHCRDGETFIGKVLAVSEQEQDLIYDLVSTSKESRYEKADRQPVYLIGFQDIDAVELLQRPS